MNVIPRRIWLPGMFTACAVFVFAACSGPADSTALLDLSVAATLEPFAIQPERVVSPALPSLDEVVVADTESEPVAVVAESAVPDEEPAVREGDGQTSKSGKRHGKNQGRNPQLLCR